MDYCKNISAKFISAMQKRPGLLAVLAFLSGVASFALVDRKESFSQVIAIFLLISWLWLIIDNWLRDKVEEKFGVAVSPNVMRFALQMVQQESLFFALPFFFSGYAVGPSSSNFYLPYCFVCGYIGYRSLLLQKTC